MAEANTGTGSLLPTTWIQPWEPWTGIIPVEGLPKTTTETSIEKTQAGSGSRKRLIDADSATRKTFPMAAGLLDYFPDALAAVAAHSKKAGDKHHPGEPMHWERGKSKDHADCIIRHLVNRGGFDGDDRESTALAWRALALLQEELEEAYGLAKPRNAT